MKLPSILSIALAATCLLPANPTPAQALPTIPQRLDPGFWGRTNTSYCLMLTSTTTDTQGTHTSARSSCRDATGRVRSESLYNNGKLSTVEIRDPRDNTMTLMHVVSKTADVIRVPQINIPSLGRGWTVERLPSRIIAGLPADGFRFTRTTNPEAGETPVTLVEEDWISNELGIVLERTINDPHTGSSSTETVARLDRVEPDPALFTIPSDYSIQRLGSSNP